MRPERRRELVCYLETTYQVSERRGCAALRFNRASHRYRTIRNDQAVLSKADSRTGCSASALRLLSHLHPASPRGVENQSQARVSALSHGRVKHAAEAAAATCHGGAPPNRPAAGAINENWSMDFVSDALFDGRRIRALTVVDDYSRESLAIEVGQSITGRAGGDGHESAQCSAWSAQAHPRRQRARVRVKGTRSVGVSPCGYPRLQPAREADRQCAGRIFQRTVARRMSEHQLVSFT